MTRFEKIKQMSLEEMTKVLDKVDCCMEMPWDVWWGQKYCANCEPEVMFIDYLGREAECAYCEKRDECKFFPGQKIPSGLEVIEEWLKDDGEIN